MTAFGDLQYPYPQHIQRRLDECLSFGTTGIIELLPCGNVRKSCHPHAGSHDRKWMRRNLDREFDIYQRLPKLHDRLVRMISYSEEGLVLEYMPNGNLREYLESHAATITFYQRLEWAADAAEALQLLHSHGIIHCDVKPENFLLDSKMRLRIIDFSGSSIDGKESFVLENARFFLPRPWEEPCTILTDLFALGSTIYEIMTGCQPYKGLGDDDVESRYKKRQFPPVNDIPCGDVIKKCWLSELDSAEKALLAMNVEKQKYMLSIYLSRSHRVIFDQVSACPDCPVDTTEIFVPWLVSSFNESCSKLLHMPNAGNIPHHGNPHNLPAPSMNPSPFLSSCHPYSPYHSFGHLYIWPFGTPGSFYAHACKSSWRCTFHTCYRVLTSSRCSV